MTHKNTEYNTNRANGTYGADVLTTGTSAFPTDQEISAIEVLSGTATVTGKQITTNSTLTSAGYMNDWTDVELGVGAHITPLKEVTIVIDGSSIVYYG